MSKYEISQHAFTATIIDVMKAYFGEYAMDVLDPAEYLVSVSVE